MAHMMTVTVAQMDMQVEELALAVQTKVNVSEMQKKNLSFVRSHRVPGITPLYCNRLVCFSMSSVLDMFVCCAHEQTRLVAVLFFYFFFFFLSM